jgi:YVTN family beta-propeller protein
MKCRRTLLGIASLLTSASRPIAMAFLAFIAICLLGGAQSLAQNAYVTSDNSVSVVDTTTNTVTATIPVDYDPTGIVVTPDGSKAYVGGTALTTTGFQGSVFVIDTATNTVAAAIPVDPVGGNRPLFAAIAPDGSNTVSLL